MATELVETVGARPVILAPERHDRLVAGISHLPYLLASSLVDAVSDVGETDPTVWDLAAGGFRDTSRVAASDTHMFLDILMTNRTAVLGQIDSFSAHLDKIRDLLVREDEEGLGVKLDGRRRRGAGGRKAKKIVNCRLSTFNDQCWRIPRWQEVTIFRSG